MFGALAGSGLLHGTGYIHAVPPWRIGSSAVIALGALVGSRFANATACMLVGYLGAAFGSFAVSMAVAAFFIAIVAYFFPFPIANIVIAFSPSTRDTMMVLALALHLDPVYVGAHHLARFLVVTFSVAIAASDRAAKDRGTQSQTAGANEDRAIIPRSITHWPNRGGCLDPRTIDFLLLDTRPGIATLPEILLLGAVAHHAGISNLGSFLGLGFLRQAKYSVRFIRWGRRNGDAFRF